MKIKSQKELGIIKVDEVNFASLVSARKNGFQYEFTYFINATRAMSKECNIVRIELLSKITSPNKTATTTQNLVSKLLKGTAEKKDSQRSQSQDLITSLLSDFTSSISNTHTSLSTKSATDNFSKTLQLRSVEELTNRDLLIPVTQQHAYTLPDQFRYDSTRNKELAMSLICDYGIDPSQVGENTNFILSAQKVKNSTIPAKTTSLPGQTRFLVDSIIQSSLQPTNQLQLPTNEYVATFSSVENSFVATVEEIEIPITAISNFFVRFTLMDKNQNEIESVIRQVDHTNLANIYRQPRLSPYISAAVVRPGKNVIEIKQRDPRGKKIQVFRKIINNNLENSSAYTFVAQIDAINGQTTQRLEDVVSNGTPVIYRAIAIGEQGVLSAEFSSAVTSALHQHSQAHSPKKNFLTLTHVLQDAGVLLELRDIPTEITTIRVYRVNLTLGERVPVQIGASIQTLNEHLPTTTFLDINVKPGNVYNYTCKFYNRFGKEESTNVAIAVEFTRKTQEEVVISKLSSPTITPNGSFLDVSFTISTLLNRTVVGSVQDALQSQGNVAYFTGDFTAVRSQIQNLIAYSVSRTNMLNGEISDFGVLADPQFSDNRIGSLRAIPPPLPGVSYRYTVTTYLRKADTMLNIDRIVPIFDGRSTYTFKPSRWLHPLAIDRGTIVSPESLLSLHGKNEFLYGALGTTNELVVLIPDTVPSISEVKTQKINNKTVSIQWKVIGNTAKIDYFIIVLSILGMRTILGKCHNLSDAGIFKFIHDLDRNEQGILKYSVIPVYVDYTRGTEAQSQNNIVAE
jgi:hypothetical protein